jgi:hypothetical protein
VRLFAFFSGPLRNAYRRTCQWPAATPRLLPLLVLLMPVGVGAQGTRTIYLADNSDWWSILRSASFGDGIPVQKREPPAANYRILDIDLRAVRPLRQVFAKLGSAVAVQRGDAATGRTQLCYESASERSKVYLIFEVGEVEDSFYLFQGGPSWKGDSSCATSTRVSASLRSDAGIGLGETRSQVQALLGKPSLRQSNALIYCFSVEKRSSPKDMEAARKANPNMSEKELEENFGSYNLWAYIEVRFRAQKVTYLTVSLSETY